MAPRARSFGGEASAGRAFGRGDHGDVTDMGRMSWNSPSGARTNYGSKSRRACHSSQPELNTGRGETLPSAGCCAVTTAGRVISSIVFPAGVASQLAADERIKRVRFGVVGRAGAAVY